MAETPDPVPAHADADPATLAFEALREEVALVRRAVAGLSAERASIEIPDYSETLGQIMRASAATAQNLKALAEITARFPRQRRLRLHCCYALRSAGSTAWRCAMMRHPKRDKSFADRRI